MVDEKTCMYCVEKVIGSFYNERNFTFCNQKLEMRVEMNYRNLLKGGLAAAMAFTMAACGSNSGSASGSTDSQSSGDAGKTAFKLCG